MSRDPDRLIHWLLDSLQVQTSLFHLGQYCGSWQASSSGHGRAGFHVVLHGQCWLHLPGQAAPQRLDEGEAIFFLRDVPHILSTHADGINAHCAPRQTMQAMTLPQAGSTGLACGFFEFMAPLNTLFLESFPDYVVIGHDCPLLHDTRPLFDLILSEGRRVANTPSPLVTRLVEVVLFYVIRHLCQRDSVSRSLWSVLARPEFADLLTAIMSQPADDWSVTRMAERSHMSRATFCKHFSRLTGTSPNQFVTHVRMQLAGALLRRGESIARAAERVGYQSEAAFARAFKKVVGIQPGSLRRSTRA